MRAKNWSFVGWTFIALLLVARLHLMRVRYFDVDEFEHLFAGWQVADGHIPYRDFFEHHGPITYYLGAIAAWTMGPRPGLLFADRLLSYLFLLLTLFGAWKLARTVHGRLGAVVALAWLVSFPWFAEKTVEWRPGTPAMCFVAWSAWFVIRRRRGVLPDGSWNEAATTTLPAGFLFGMASLCTLKVAFLGLGMALGASATMRARKRSVILNAAAAAFGFTLAWATAAGWFALQGGCEDFFQCVIGYPWRWKLHFHYYGHLLAPLGGAPAHVSLMLLGLLLSAVRFRRLAARVRGEPVLFLGSLIHLLATPLAKVVYLDYYVIAMPLTAALAAGAGLWLTAGARSGFAGRGSNLSTWTPFAVAAGALLLDVVAGLASWRAMTIRWFDVVALAAAITAVVLVRAQLPHGRTLFWTALLLPSMARMGQQHFGVTNEHQLDHLAFIEQIVRPDETVLEGFNGLGCIRPHSTYWSWINLYNIDFVREAGSDTAIVESVRRGEPALIIYDRDLDMLRAELEPAMQEHYLPLKKQPIPNVLLILRRDLHDRIRRSSATRPP